MPGFDRTGPEGRGPMTGGGRGFCAYPYPGMTGQSSGRGFFGRGGGRGRRNRFCAAGLPEQQRTNAGFPAYGWSGVPFEAEPYDSVRTVQEEKKFLMEQVAFLKERLNEIQNRIAALEKEES